MNYFSFSGALLFITNTILAVVILFGGRKLENILGLFIAVSTALLGYGIFQVGFSNNPEEALFWWRLMYVGIIPLPPFIIHIVYILFRKYVSMNRPLVISAYITSSIFLFINISGNLIEKVTFLFGSLYFDYPINTLFFFFFLYFSFAFNYVVGFLIKIYKKAFTNDQLVAKKAFFFGMGIFFGLTGGIGFYLPAFGLEIYPYFGILTNFYSIFVGYAILNHHLFDARFAILRVLRFLTITGITVFIGWILWGLSERFLDYTPQIHGVEIIFWGILLLVMTFLYRSRRVSSFFLLSSLVEFAHDAQVFLEKKDVYEDRATLLIDLEHLFMKGLKVRKVKLLTGSIHKNFPESMKYFWAYRKPLILSELLAEERDEKSASLIRELESTGEAIFPIDLTEGRLSFLVLGPKESEDAITPSEVRIINQTLPKIALALQILDFNSALQNEVQVQTRAIAKQNRELALAYERLKEFDRNKDNFLAIASHELRTPMTIIKGYADLFLKQVIGKMTEKQEIYMKKIFQSTESLIELVNNILDISKIEAGRIEIILADVNVHSAITKCVDDFQDMFAEKKVALLLTDSIDFDIIKTDESKFRLVLSNLLSNAYKFTPVGGKVEVKAWNDEKYLHVRVSDTGRGIPRDQIEHVFDKFNQSNNNDYTKKSIRGTGLGLNLSKQVIEMLGGSIHVDSEQGKGSTFEFILKRT